MAVAAGNTGAGRSLVPRPQLHPEPHSPQEDAPTLLSAGRPRLGTPTNHRAGRRPGPPGDRAPQPGPGARLRGHQSPCPPKHRTLVESWTVVAPGWVAGSQPARPAPWQRAQNSALERSLQLSGQREESLCQGLRVSGGRPPDPGPRLASRPSLSTLQPETASDQPARGAPCTRPAHEEPDPLGCKWGHRHCAGPWPRGTWGRGCMPWAPRTAVLLSAGCTGHWVQSSGHKHNCH